MTDKQKCRAVASYIVDNMTYQEMWQYVLNAVYDEVSNSDKLEEYMADCGLTEQHLEEIGGR